MFKEHTPAPTTEVKSDPLALSDWAHAPLPGERGTPPERAPRHILAGRTEYYWGGDNLLAEQRGTSLTEYAIWRSVAQALWEDGVLRHVINSELGAPKELVDEHGRLVWQATFDDWGRLLSEKGTTTCRLRLPGQLVDDETGLHYNRFRYYSPAAGQFVSPDPLSFAVGYNAYRFAPNAIGWVDPLGLTCGQNGCETYYRTMSQEQLEELQRTGRVPPTRETFISPTRGFSEDYQGRLVQISVKSGTTAQLEAIGVRDTSRIASAAQPNMPVVGKGWTAQNAFFKGEGQQVNIGLGRGTALDTFNNNITGFSVLR